MSLSHVHWFSLTTAAMNDIDKEAGFGDLCDRIRNDFNNMKMVLRCGICCSTLKDPVVTTCLHAFCRQCINYCIDKLNTLRCPICKQKLNKRSCGSCPQLSDMVHDYLRLVETYRHECLQAHVPEEAMFTESQVVMTENVNGTVGHSPLQETTNTARTFEEPESAPLLSDQHIKRKRVASCSEANPRLQKMIRSDADRARFEENGMCLESSAYSHLKQWNSLCRPSSKCSLSRAVGVIANSSSSLSTDSGNVNRPPYDRVEVEFMKPLKPMVAVTCVKVSDDKVKGFDVNEMVSVEQLKGRKVLDWTVEQDNGRKANLVEASSQTRNCAAEICAQHSSKSPTASALAQGREYETHDVCIQASVSPEAHGNAEVQVMQKCNGVVMQSERANILQHASVQTISECTETGVQTWQPSNELCEAFVQTDFESNSRQAGIQTDFSIYATGKAIGWVKSVAETCVEASSGKADPFRDSAGDAATKLELMVRRRFEKQSAETRVQALLACLPWIPTFLRMDYDGFCRCLEDNMLGARLEDNMLDAIGNSASVGNVDDDGRSVVEASEDGTEKPEEASMDSNDTVRNAERTIENELNVEESGHSELDYEKSTRRESDHQAKRVLEQEPSPEAVGEHNCASQKAVKATETSAVFASEEVGTNSHEVRSSRSDIKFMVSGLSENSEAEAVRDFLRAFPMAARFSRDMTRDCTHLILFNTDGCLCKSRSTKYAYAIANRCVVVTHQWIRDCVKLGHLLSTEMYEVEGDAQVNPTSRAAQRAREGSGNLFAGFTFFLPAPYFRFTKVLTKDRLSEIIHMQGGQCIERLWDLPLGKRSYIIFGAGSCSADAARRFELDKGVKVLRADWVLDSICEYRVLQHNTHIYRIASCST